jgi:cardiolipin synthase (CMP-forming)
MRVESPTRKNVQSLRRGWMTLANLITILRLLLVPFVVFALLSGSMGWAFAGFVVAGMSDALDGYLARRLNQESELGAYLDPTADKLLLVSVFLVLGFLAELPLWLVIIVVSRDALIVGAVVLSSVMARPVAARPLMISKATTAIQIVLVALVLAELAFEMRLGPAREVVGGLTVLLTVASTAAYLVAWLRHMSDHGQSSDSRK